MLMLMLRRRLEVMHGDACSRLSSLVDKENKGLKTTQTEQNRTRQNGPGEQQVQQIDNTSNNKTKLTVRLVLYRPAKKTVARTRLLSENLTF
jgi:hypothetical protein